MKHKDWKKLDGWHHLCGAVVLEALFVESTYTDEAEFRKHARFFGNLEDTKPKLAHAKAILKYFDKSTFDYPPKPEPEPKTRLEMLRSNAPD